MKHFGCHSKLSEAQLDECARAYRKEGATLKEIAARFDVSTSTIQNALKMRGVAIRRHWSRGKKAEVGT